MLDIMRKHARNWIMKVLLGIIIIVFIFYFGSTAGRRKADTLVTVGGKAITLFEFEKEYRDQVEMYRQRMGGRLNEEMLKTLNVKQQVLDRLVQQEILLQKAKELRIETSDEEVRSLIASLPAFQRQGVFDERLYQQMLRHYRMTPEDFETVQRNTLVAMKIEDLIQDGAHVTEQEVRDLYRSVNERLNITVARVSPAAFRKEVKIEAGELENYLKEHSAEFRKPEQIQVKYIFFSAAEYGKNTPVTEEEIAEALRRGDKQTSKDQKTAGARREEIIAELRHTKGMRLAFSEAKKAHDIIYQQENFEAYAAQNGLPVVTTPLFSPASIPPELRGVTDLTARVFPLQKNDTSSVLSSDRGYYLMKVIAKQPAYTPSLKEIEGDIRQRLTEIKAGKMAREEAIRLIGRMKNGETLTALAREHSLPVGSTGMFTISSPPAKLGSSPELRRALTKLSKTKPYAEDPLPSGGDYLLIQVKERGQIDEGGYAAQQAALKGMLLNVKRSELIRSWLEGTKAAMIKEGRIKYHKEVKDL
ncbi:MAG: SurA N-terminal domain-containing protein [Syntrophales bacterium]|nr:SurA N-terminal domain-containing protein [Syntrophales bacterium]